MVLIIGAIVVFASVLIGFVWSAGWKTAILENLLHGNEYLVIIGAAVGSMIIMAPLPVLKDLFRKVMAVFKGMPYNQQSYEDLFQACLLYTSPSPRDRG